MVIIGVTGYSIERHDGYTARMDDPEQPVINAINKRLDEDNKRCLKEIPDWKSDENDCMLQRNPGENTIALIGDSHARQIYFGLVANTNENSGVVVFPASCAVPLIGMHSGIIPNNQSRERSEHLLSEGFEFILNHRNLKKVVLAHNPACSWHNIVDTYNIGNKNFESILQEGFARTYRSLTEAGKEIYVILDNPHYSDKSFKKCRSATVRRPWSINFLSSKNLSSCTEKQSAVVHREVIDNWSRIARKQSSGVTIHSRPVQGVRTSIFDEDFRAA